MEKFIKLVTERLMIRDHEIEDLKNHHLLLSDDKVMYYLQDLKSNSLETSKENLMQAIKSIKEIDRKLFFFAIINKNTNAHIGEIGFHVVKENKKGKHVHLGYFIHQAYWGKGYTSEAVKAVLDYVFDRGDIYKITSGCLKEHKASKRILEKYSFKYIDSHQVLHFGKYKEHINYQLVNK